TSKRDWSSDVCSSDLERTLRYIDSDGHILEPPTGMLEFAPAEYRDRIWHIEIDADGTECSVWNRLRMPSTGLGGTAGFDDEKVEIGRASCRDSVEIGG